jgi:hypothetical protein
MWTEVESGIWQDENGRYHSIGTDGQTWLAWDIETARENRGRDATTALACMAAGNWRGVDHALHTSNGKDETQDDS